MKNGVSFEKKQLEINSNLVRRPFCYAKHIFLRQRLDATVGFKRCEVADQPELLPLSQSSPKVTSTSCRWPSSFKLEEIVSYEIVKKRVGIVGLRLLSLIRPACKIGPWLAAGKWTGTQVPSRI